MTTNFSRVVAYDKVIKVVADTVKLETHKEEIKLVEQSKAWGFSFEYKVLKELEMQRNDWMEWLPKSQTL